MNNCLAVLGALLLGAALAPAQSPPTKPATINVQSAILSTKEGRKAAEELTNRFTSQKQALEKEQADLTALQSRMRSGSATLSKEAKDRLIADIDARTKDWNRESQDFNNEVQEAEAKIMNDVGQKMLDLIQKYASQHGVFFVADVSNPRTPVIWADSSLDITNEIIKLYDEAHPLPAGAPASPAPPPAKKQ